MVSLPCCIYHHKRYESYLNLFFFLEDGAQVPLLDQRIQGIEDPSLKEKAGTLPELLNAAYANSTLRKYKPAWQKWREWASQFNEVSYCPADPFFVAVYLNDLTSSNATEGAITAAVMGIRWGHRNSGFNSPTDNPLVKLALEGSKRLIAARNPVAKQNRKEPITSDLLKAIVDEYRTTENLMDIRFVLMTVLGFCGFLRISEMLEIQIKDISFCEDGVKIFLPFSKTDQVREGSTVFISETFSDYCPVCWLQKYLYHSKLQKPEDFLFCRLFKCKIGHSAHGHLKISYTTARESFKLHLSNIVANTKDYGLHSLRSGGATEAANNGVTDRMISKHGRWSSNTSRNTYIKDCHKKRFNVSKSLGI